MTTEQKLQIEQKRHNNQSYTAIAKTLGISLSSVKAYCQRNGLTGNRSKANDDEKCKECGKTLCQVKGKKTIKFCSSTCRQKWWNAHQNEVNKKALYSYSCAKCGKAFSAYGNSHRKYCSHACYVAARFGGGTNE